MSAPGVAKAPAPRRGSLADLERLREISLARLRAEELRAREAEWVECGIAATVWRKNARNIRAALRPIADVVAPGVPGASTREIAVAVHDAVYGALNDLCDGFEQRHRAQTTAKPAPPISDRATRIEAEKLKAGVAARSHAVDLAIAQGRVIRMTEYSAAVAACASRVRSRLLQMEGVLPPRLVGRSEVEARRIVRGAIDEALQNLPVDPPAALVGPPRAMRRRAGRKAA